MIMRRFEMYWPDFGSVISVDLLDEENPGLCEEFWQRLPFKTLMTSSMSAGEMLKVPLTFTLSAVTDTQKLHFFPEAASGTIFSYSLGLLIKVGIVAEPFYIPRLGTMRPEELAKFKPIATRLREAYFFTKEVNFATLRRAGC
jgi:hypothetical protein